MPVFIRLRFLAIRLVHSLRRSLITQAESWTIDADREGRPIVSAGPFRILIVPRRVRLFDAIHLYCDDTEIWLPVVQRIRLRTAMRLYLLRYSHNRWLAAGPPPQEKRARRRQPQPA